MNPPTPDPDSGHTHQREDAPTVRLTPTSPATGDPAGSRAETMGAESSKQSSCTDTPSASPLPELPVELVNHPRYEILKVLGSGGMGTVYKARHRLMDRVVALKVVHSHLLNQPEIVVRFEREVQLAARLSHPNIVTAYDAEAYGSLHFLVMEFVRGENLADVIAVGGPLPVGRACDYACQAAWGLHYAFRQGMIHRDIKPHNLIRTLETDADGNSREVVKILDFGLARLVQEIHTATTRASAGEGSSPQNPSSGPTAHETAFGAVMGTWNYMAPEQAESAHRADIRSDIYSLGCTLYHMLLGRPPFAGLSAEQKREMHRHAIPAPLTDGRPDVPAGLAAVVARMLAKDPGERYQTPAEVAEALTAYLRSSAITSATAPSEPSGSRPNKLFRPRGLLLAGAAVSLFLLGVGGLILHWHSPSGTSPPSPAIVERPIAIITTEARQLRGHTSPIWSLVYSPDGQTLFSGGREGVLRVWDVATGRERHAPLRGHTGTIRGIAVSVDGRLALSAGEDGTARVWDLASGRETARFVTNPPEVLTSVALCSNGKRALCGGQKNTWLWDVANGKTLLRLPRWAETVAFSLDGRHAVSGGWDNIVYIWDLKTGLQSQALPGHTGGIKSVAFSPDGTRILSGAEDRTICLWDAAEGKRLRQWEAHKGFIWNAVFSPDGRRALSVSWDRTARLWDLNDGRELQRFAPECEELCCCAISPDGRFAACGGSDRIIRLWELPP